jgi:hypothetical protein
MKYTATQLPPAHPPELRLSRLKFPEIPPFKHTTQENGIHFPVPEADFLDPFIELRGFRGGG